MFFAITFLFFHRFQLSLLQKVAGVHSNRTQQAAIENSEGFGSYGKKTKFYGLVKFSKSVEFCFFAITFLFFNRFYCFWSRKTQNDSSDRLQQRSIRNTKGFGSYKKKQNEKNKKTKKKTFFFCFFAYNFSVFSPISTFFAAKGCRRAQPPALQRAIGNTKGFGSYEEKTKKLKAKKQKKRHFCFCFLL